jgi:glycosyltransferase involved in cell wall biosynthesis
MLIERLPFFYAYGGMQALRLCKELQKRKVGVFIVSKIHDKKKRNWYNTKEIDGVTVYAMNCKSYIMLFLEHHFGLNLEYYFKAVFFLLWFRQKYDLVHVHGLTTFHILIVIPLKFLGKKTLAKLSTFPDDDLFSVGRRRFIGSLLLRILSYFDGIVSINSQFTENYRKFRKSFSPNKLFEVPNGVDITEFRPVSPNEKLLLREQLDLPIQKKIVSYVGWISENKGVHLLIKSWQSVVAKRRDVLLLLIGPTKDKRFSKMIHSMIKLGDLKENVSLTGFVNGTRAKEFLQASDIFMFLSKEEGNPNVLLEAASCGLPCIVTDAPWARDILKNEVEGYLVDRHNSEQLRDSMMKLIKSRSLRLWLGGNARKKMVERFSIGTIAEKYIGVYTQILRGKEKDGQKQ